LAREVEIGERPRPFRDVHQLNHQARAIYQLKTPSLF
jgi:hypothetical protein